MKKIIDINCDIGESFGVYSFGTDKEIMPYISSANIACGFHAGDPHVMRETVELALQHNVQIGAHIGFPDRLGFGRREIKVSPQEVYDYIIYQLGALDAFVKIAGSKVSHVKLHGALYMMACSQADLATSTVKAVKDYDKTLEIFGLPQSQLAIQSLAHEMPFKNEFFADRPYYENEVKMFNWTLDEIGSTNDIAQNVLHKLEHLNYDSINTICVHSDTPNVVKIMHTLHETLTHNNWYIGTPATP